MRFVSVLTTLSLLCSLSMSAFARAQTTKEEIKTIAVADFTGADKEFGRFIADTLLTDLARSTQLSLVERNEIRQAFQELKLQSTGLTEPKQIQKVGKILSADGLIVGSYFLQGTTLTINARLLDVHTGHLAQGGSANVSGQKENLLLLSEQLANRLHKNLTGIELLTEPVDSVEAPPTVAPSSGNPPAAPTPVNRRETLATRLKDIGVIPAGAKAQDTLQERDIARVVQWVQRQFPRQERTPLNISKPNAPVNRLRVLAAMLKIAVPLDNITRFSDAPDNSLTPDFAKIPLWGRPFVASAIEERWWSANHPILPAQAATWRFVVVILDRMPLDPAEGGAAPTRQTSPETPASAETYSGLVLDASTLTVERAMSPRIVDEDGVQIYPLKGSYDFDSLLERGLMSYCETTDQTRKRAGANPLKIPVIEVIAPANADFVISRSDGEKIRNANRRNKFLEKWAVSVLSQTKTTP